MQAAAAEADDTTPDDLRESTSSSPSKAEYAPLHEQKLHEAERERDRIVQWIWDAHAFTTQQKSHLVNWLGDWFFAYPGAMNGPNETAPRSITSDRPRKRKRWR
jgi:hypothetical protein